MNQTINKLKNGFLAGIGFLLAIGITGLSYAAFSWITQSEVTGGQTLSASSWNNMLNNQNYLKEQVEGKLPTIGGTMSGAINMGTNKVTNLGAPIASTDAATKAYADSVSASGGGQYQISCFGSSLTYGVCLRIDTITGVTECKQANSNFSVWSSCSNPW